MKDYLSKDFCLSCTYFQQSKGHFGQCQIIKNKKDYDGSRKGTSCLCWRQKSSLLGLENQIDKEEQPHIVSLSAIRKRYNEKVKAELKRKNDLKYPREQVAKRYDDSKWLYGLPFSQSSDIHMKRGFYRHKNHSRVIEYAISLMDGKISLGQIARMVYQKFNKKLSKTTILNWQRKFMPHVKFPKGRKHDEQWNKNIMLGTKKYYSTHSQKGKGKGISKKRKWMLEMQKKYSDNEEIVSILDKEIKQLQKPMEILICQ